MLVIGLQQSHIPKCKFRVIHHTLGEISDFTLKNQKETGALFLIKKGLDNRLSLKCTRKDSNPQPSEPKSDILSS